MSRRNAGDTIVEVLIAMAVASFVLGGAYVVVNRTLANARQAQEHSEALKIAQGQLEQLRVLYADNAAKFDSNTTCMTGNSADPVKRSSEAICQGRGDNNLYNIEISPIPSDADYPKATVTINWDGATGGRDKVSLTYRIPK